ncbi:MULTISPECIES: cytochrome P450 [Streptomyces]|nr:MULTISPECIES: cytochrome P450 [Streptomyces]MVO85454.1 cytochrome P450 [Streptomyces typhae]
MAESPVSLRELMTPEAVTDPYPLYARLHRHGDPVVTDASGAHVVSGYAECHALLRDARCGSDETRSTMFEAMRSRGDLDDKDAALLAKAPFMLLDPPEHTRLRRLAHTCLIPAFDGLPERIARIVAELLDTAAAQESLDVVGDYAFPLPVRIICELLALPQADFPRLGRWSGALARNMDQAFNLDEEARRDGREARGAILDYFHRLIPERRARPGDDVVSQLVALADQGAADTDEVAAVCSLLLVAGHETTVNLIANGVLALTSDPQLRETVAAAPEAAKALVEEVLRFDPPLHFRTRVALADIEVAGHVVPRGATLVLLLAAANRDPRRFDEPDVFRLDRRANRHLGFGIGPHACLGAALARVEGESALGAFARRVRNPQRPAGPLTYRPGLAMRGLAELPIHHGGITAA